MHIQKRKKKGRVYYYLVRSGRVNGKPRIVWQMYLGTADRVKQIFERKFDIRLKTFEFGKTAAILSIADELSFVDIINKYTDKKKTKGLSVGEYLLLIILGRCHGPLSKSETGRWFHRSPLKLLWHVPHKLSCQNFLNHMAYISDEKMRQIEEEIAMKLIEKGISPLLLIWDTTNFFTYINKGETLPQPGHSREGRHEKNLVSLGLAVSQENIPFLHETYEGNKHDAKIFSMIIDKIVERLSKLKIGVEDLVLVFDKGNNSEENIGKAMQNMHIVTSVTRPQVRKELRIPIDKYQFLYKTEKGNEIYGYRTRGNFFGKEFTLVMTYNPKSYEKQRKTYEAKKAEILSQLEELKEKTEGKRKGRKITQKGIIQALGDIIPKNYRAIFSYEIKNGKFHYKVNENVERELYDSFGKIAIITDKHDWDSEKIVRAYNSKYLIEDDFKWFRDEVLIPIEPYFVWLDKSIRVHTFLMVMGLLFYRYLIWKVKMRDISPKELVKTLEGIRIGVVYNKTTGEVKTIIEEMDEEQKSLFSLLRLDKYAPK